MSHELQTLEPDSIPIWLSLWARQTARKFADEQFSSLKAQQVYHNTLAVYGVNSYLRIVAIPTELTASDSWNGAVRLVADVADLWIRGVGRLECRPLQPDQSAYIPPEARFDRFGCMVVRINSEETEATLLGFFAAESDECLPERIRLEDLQPSDVLITYITEREAHRIIELRQWLQNSFEPDWLPPEELLAPLASRTAPSPVTPEFEPSKSVSRAKVIDLGREVAGQKVALVLQLIPKTGEEFALFLFVYPAGDWAYLPPALQVTVLDEEGIACMEDQARGADSGMRLEFGAVLREKFSVRLTLGNICITEQFMV